jgi:hypothetical protein
MGLLLHLDAKYMTVMQVTRICSGQDFAHISERVCLFPAVRPGCCTFPLYARTVRTAGADRRQAEPETARTVPSGAASVDEQSLASSKGAERRLLQVSLSVHQDGTTASSGRHQPARPAAW